MSVNDYPKYSIKNIVNGCIPRTIAKYPTKTPPTQIINSYSLRAKLQVYQFLFLFFIFEQMENIGYDFQSAYDFMDRSIGRKKQPSDQFNLLTKDYCLD